MDIINNIIEYFPTVGGYVRKTTLLYNQIAPIINAISKVKDCEVFPPNSIAIKKSLEDSGDFNSIDIIEKLKKPQLPISSFVLDDPFIIQNQRISDIIQNINSKFYESLSNNNLLDVSISEEIFNESLSIGDPCDILEKDIADALKRNQNLNSDFKKTIKEDSKAFKVLERCKNDVPLLKSLQNPEIWTSEELQKVIDNCLLPEDVPIGISNDLTASPNFGDVTSGFEIDDDDLPVEGEGLSLDEIFKNFKNLADTLDKEDDTSVCAEKIFNATKYLQEAATSETKDKQNELNLKFDFEYETIFNSSIIGVISGIKSAVQIGIGVGLQPLKIESLNKYSDEITLNTKNINFSVRSAKIPIGFKKVKKKNKGSRFAIEKKYGDIIRNKKFNSYEEYDSIIKKKDKEIEKLLKSYKSIAFKDGVDTGKSYGNKFTSNQNNKILDNLKITKSDSDKRLKIIQDKLNKIAIDRKEREDKTKNILEELENLKCDSNLRVAKDIPDETTDFRGVPDPSNPTIHDGDYWRRFADLASKVGLLPIPQFIGSNDFKVQFTGEDAQVKLPSGSIAIDEDGIPRFLFWPIGLPIPSPTPPDFLLRIPMPMLWKYMAKFELKDPLKELEKKLTEKYSDIEGLRDAAFIISQDDPLDVAYSKIPNNTLQTIIKLMGISEVPAFTFAMSKLSEFNSEIIAIIRSKIFDYAQNNAFDPKMATSNEANKADAFLNNLISEIALELQRKIQPIITDINNAIEDAQKSINFKVGDKNLLDYLNDLTTIVNAANDILKIFTACIEKEEDFKGVTDFTGGAGTFMTDLRGATNYVVNTPFDVGDLLIPFLKLDEYLGISSTAKDILKPITDKIKEYSDAVNKEIQEYKDSVSDVEDDIKKYINERYKKYKQDLTEYIDELKKDFKDSEIYEMFPKLKFLCDIINGKLLRRFYNLIKAGLINVGFDFRSLLNLPNLSTILTNITLLQYNFPHLLFVFFIGFNPLPYPFLLCVNLSNAAVPGLIEPNAIKFVATADITSPIKMIKRNWGSHTVPIKTQIEGLINSSMGLGFSDKNGVVPNICPKLGDIKSLRLDNIVENILKPTKISLERLKRLSKKNISNLISWPNPNLICEMIQSQNLKEDFKKALNYDKLKNSTLPPSFTKKKEGISNGLSDLKNGKIKIDELKTTFGVQDFPSIAEVLPMDQGMQSTLTFADMGITAEAIFDLFPELTNAAPYVQDDLPTWERLHLGNIPFVLFLAEFLVAAKKGARFPIPEVNPLLEMR